MGGRNSTPRKDEIITDSSRISKQFPAEPNRYHLYVSYSCPFAHRCLITHSMKGLGDVISISFVHPIFQKTKPDDAHDTHHGWAFNSSQDESSKSVDQFKNEASSFIDPINNAKYVRDLYDISKKDDSKYTIPILWDKSTNTIVSNDSLEICFLFEF